MEFFAKYVYIDILSSGKVEMYLCATCHAFNFGWIRRKIEYALWFRLRVAGSACPKINSKSKEKNNKIS